MTTTIGLGVGGSSTRALVVDDDTGVVVTTATHPGGNLVFDAGTLDRLAAIVAAAGADRAGIALAGVRTTEDGRRAETAIAARTGVPTAVVADHVAAHHACFGSGPGIVVVAGTGSVGRARDADGGTLRLGGFGPLLGDEGSAWWIGRRAVTAALRADDGIGPATRLLDALASRVEGGLAAVVTAGPALLADRSRLAALAPLVDELGPDDDVARAILQEAGRELAHLAATARARLGPLPVGLVGGVFASTIVTAAVTAELGEVITGRQPVVAAIDLARRTLGTTDPAAG